MRLLPCALNAAVVATLLSSPAVAAPKVGVQLTNLDAPYRTFFSGAATKIYGDLATAKFGAVNMKRCGCTLSIDGKKNSIIFHAIFNKADYPKLRLPYSSTVQLGYLDYYLYYIGAVRSWASTLAVQKKNYSAAMAIQKVELIVALHEEGTENTIVMWGDELGNGYAFAGQAYFTDGIMDLNAIGEIAQRDGMLQVYDAKDMAGRYTVAARARKMLGLAY